MIVKRVVIEVLSLDTVKEAISDKEITDLIDNAFDMINTAARVVSIAKWVRRKAAGAPYPY